MIRRILVSILHAPGIREGKAIMFPATSLERSYQKAINQVRLQPVVTAGLNHRMYTLYFARRPARGTL